MQGGVFGATATSNAICDALVKLPPKTRPNTSSLRWPLPEHFPPAPALLADDASVSPASPRGIWPFPRARTALIMIDWQRDFLEEGGFGASLGNDVSKLAPAVAPAKRVLEAARLASMPIFHTLEAHAPDLHDVAPAKKRHCPAIGDVLNPARGRVLVKGEPGNAIIADLAPLPKEEVITKPGKSAFYNTNLDRKLFDRGISHLIVTGVTTEVCFNSKRPSLAIALSCRFVFKARSALPLTAASYVSSFQTRRHRIFPNSSKPHLRKLQHRMRSLPLSPTAPPS